MAIRIRLLTQIAALHMNFADVGKREGSWRKMRLGLEIMAALLALLLLALLVEAM